MPTVKKTPGGRRRRARKLVLSALYAYYTTGGDPDTIFAGISDQESIGADPAAFARRLYTATIDHADEIDQEIRRWAANWSFERIAFMDKNILRLAIAELLILRETPPKTAINEAIELAREYSSEDSSRFINGILDTVYHQKRQQPGSA